MSKKVDARFLCENKECKCTPQHIPWSNPNEVQASQWPSEARFRDVPYEPTIKLDEDKEGAKRHKHDDFKKLSTESSQRRKRRQKIAENDKSVAMKETVRFEEKEKVKEANPTGNITYSSSLYELSARNENEHGAQVADNEIGTKNRGTAGGRRVISHSRDPGISPGSVAFPRQAHNHHITEKRYPGAVRVAGLDCAEGYEVDERTITVGYDGQATVASHEQSTVNIIAQVVDTEEEDRRFHQQERIRLERDQFLRERNQLRRIMDNTIIVDPVVVPDRDVQNTNVEVNQGDTNDGESLENNGHKCGTRGRRWLAVGVILLIVVALVVVLAIVLQNPDDPTRPPGPVCDGNNCETSYPTPTDPPDGEIQCDQMADGSLVCPVADYPTDGFTLDLFCPASASTTADCTACAIIAPDGATQCNSCTLCSSDTIPAAFDCSNAAEGDCVTVDCEGTCYPGDTGNSTAVRALLNIFYTIRGWRG